MPYRRSERLSTSETRSLRSRSKSPSLRRTMTLRSACRGDSRPTGDTPEGSPSSSPQHNHHHHHHHHDHSEHNTRLVAERFDTGASSQADVVSAANKLNNFSSQQRSCDFLKGEGRSLSVRLERKELMTVTSVNVIKKSSPETTSNLTGTVGTFSSGSHYKSPFVGRASINSGSLTDKGAYTFSLPIVPVSPIVSVTPTVSTEVNRNLFQTSNHSLNQSKYSDYSSGDDLDLDDQYKTDYTYARSSSYASPASHPTYVLPPNMSRTALRSRSSATVTNSIYDKIYEEQKSTYGQYDFSSPYEKTTQILDQKSCIPVAPYVQSVYQMSAIENNNSNKSSKSVQNSYSGRNLRSRKTVTNRHKLAYGLDYESDDEFETSYDTSPSYLAGYFKTETTEGISWLRTMINLVDCVLPISVVWRNFWGFFYWIICYVLLLDTRILSRKVIGKKNLLWLPILLLLTGGLLSLQEYGGSEFVANAVTKASSTSSFVVSYASDLVSNGYQLSLIPMTYLATLFKSNEVKSVKVELPHVFKSQGSPEEVKAMVHAVVSKELLALTSLLESLKVHDASQGSMLESLQGQLENMLVQSKNQNKELNNIREKLILAAGNEDIEDSNRFQKMEMEMYALKENIRLIGEKQTLLQDTQALLLANVRNCCKNDTNDAALVEKQVTALFSEFMGKQLKGKTRPEVSAFIEWLKTELVSGNDLDMKLITATEKMNQRWNEDMGVKVDEMAKLAAASTVREILHQQQTRLNSNINLSTLSEAEVKKIVQKALAVYDADKTGLSDFALESGGGSIISTRCSETYSMRSAQLSFLGIPLWSIQSSPRYVIQPNVNPGECWAFKGSEGHLVIQLSGVVKPVGFSLEHISRLVAPNGNIDSAPKDFNVYGLRNEHDQEGKLIGQYTYDIDGEPVQYFPVDNPEIEAFPIIEIYIRSNYGNVDYTCLYRFRVHGTLV